jgi:hypothetical protein
VSGGEGGTQRWRRHSPIINVSTAVLCEIVVSWRERVLLGVLHPRKRANGSSALQTTSVTARDPFALPF